MSHSVETMSKKKSKLTYEVKIDRMLKNTKLELEISFYLMTSAILSSFLFFPQFRLFKLVIRIVIISTFHLINMTFNVLCQLWPP